MLNPTQSLAATPISPSVRLISFFASSLHLVFHLPVFVGPPSGSYSSSRLFLFLFLFLRAVLAVGSRGNIALLF